PFGFMKFLPGPGLGGHCIPIDPHYLAWKMRGLNYKTRFIDLAGELNTEMPVFWVRKLGDALNQSGKAVRGSRVLILGVAYKRDIEDLRESPALDIIRLLEQQGAMVAYHDPYVPRFEEDGHQFASVPLTAETLAAADCVMIVTDHSALDYELIRRHARAVGQHMNQPKIVVTKSTVPVGTAEKVRATIRAETRTPFHVCSNPEFLKEGAAIEDFMKPDRVILGVDSEEARDVMAELYAPFVRTGNPILFMDLPSAEITKYGANAMLATRISFMNQMADLCERVGADVTMVRRGL